MTATRDHEPGASRPWTPLNLHIFEPTGAPPPYPRRGGSKVGAADATRCFVEPLSRTH